MGMDIGIIEITHWMAYLFPSLSEYTTIIAPTLVLVLSIIGIFSDILPEPGSPYPVPQLGDIESELKTKGRITYKLTLLTCKITAIVNKVIMSKPYKWFYHFTKFTAKVAKRIKGQKANSATMKISKPEPYQMDLDLFKKKDKEE